MWQNSACFAWNNVMQILAFDTSTEYLSVALWQDGVVSARDVYALQSHSAQILPLIQELTQQQDCPLSSLDAIAFGAGPGSFTGLRIACGVAQGLAFANDLPVLPIGTLHAMAQQSEKSKVLACLDARMGEIYLAAYARDAQGLAQEILAPVLCHAEQAPELAGVDWVAVGTGWQVYQEALRIRYAGQLSDPSVADAPILFPSAAVIAQLAVVSFAQGGAIAPELASPLYVRNKVALKMSERANK